VAAVALAASGVACWYTVPGFATDGSATASGGPPGSGGGAEGGAQEGGTLPDGAPIGGGCEVLDVPPVSLFPMSIAGASFGGAPEIARLDAPSGSVFGIAWSDSGDPGGGETVALHFATVTPAGAVTSTKVASAGVPFVSVAATAQLFAVGASNSTEIHRFDPSGNELLPHVDLPDAGSVPYQILLAGSPDGVLVTTITAVEAFQALWLARARRRPRRPFRRRREWSSAAPSAPGPWVSGSRPQSSP
jgi:hypothetical protein